MDAHPYSAWVPRELREKSMSHWTPSTATAETPPALRLLERPARQPRTLTPLDEDGWWERQVDRLARWANVRAPWRARAPR